MGSGIYSVGVSALQNAQLGLATTSHNIANATTEGYNRQRIIQASNVATLTGSGYVGQGAHVSTIERIYSSYLSRQVYAAQTTVSELESYSSSLGQLNNLLLDDDAGLASAIESLFTGLQQLSSDPSSLTTRQTAVSAAQTLVSRFQSLNALVDTQYQGANSQIQGYVTSVNSYAQQIAALNEKIIVAESSNNQLPNDLYDQRDQLVAELNQLIGVNTTTNTNGSFNVYFGNGQQLVIGTQATTLEVVASSQDPARLTVGVVNAAGTQELPESVITGGSLGGVLQYRAQTLDDAANELGRLAATMALSFNAQHALGQDLLGNIAGDTNFAADFFDIAPPTVIANENNPGGTANVTASFSSPSYSSDGVFYTNLTTSDYRLDYDGSTFTLTRLTDNVSWSDTSIGLLNAKVAPGSADPQGFSLASTGSFLSGSSYLIQPTRNAAQSVAVNAAIAADVRLIAAAAPIRTSASASNTGAALISAGSVVAGYAAPASAVTLTYSGGQLTGFPSGASVAYSSGSTLTFDGISFTISGIPRDGDTFIIEQNSNGVSDNRNTLLLGKLQTAKTMAGNTASFATTYAQLVSDLGNKGREVETVLAAQTTMLNEAKDARDSVSGVNLDEEAAKLLEYQQAYQAAAKMLQIASELFDSILAIG